MHISHSTAELIKPSKDKRLLNPLPLLPHSLQPLLQISALTESHQQTQSAPTSISRVGKSAQELYDVRMLQAPQDLHLSQRILRGSGWTLTRWCLYPDTFEYAFAICDPVLHQQGFSKTAFANSTNLHVVRQCSSAQRLGNSTTQTSAAGGPPSNCTASPLFRCSSHPISGARAGLCPRGPLGAADSATVEKALRFQQQHWFDDAAPQQPLRLSVFRRSL
jgi:hypothetical protein